MPLQAKLQNADEIDHVHNGVMHSPFHSRTSALNINQQWSVWNGFASAVYYGDAHLEYFATRNTCAVFDVSPMRKYRFSGADAEAMLNRMVTRDISKLKNNRVTYVVWCTDEGRVIDDGQPAGRQCAVVVRHPPAREEDLHRDAERDERAIQADLDSTEHRPLSASGNAPRDDISVSGHVSMGPGP